MRILFLHRNFPAQFRHLVQTLSNDRQNQVVFITNRKEGQIPNVVKLIYETSRPVHEKTHHYVRPLEEAVLDGQGVYRVAVSLKQSGFYPDIIYAHSGWGVGLFMKDIFPKAQYLCYFEWFYHAHGTDADFDPSDPLDADSEAKIRIKNAPILLDLAACDAGLSPTLWQRQQFPLEFQRKITILHDGIDTNFFQPNPKAHLSLEIPLDDSEKKTLELSPDQEIITYVSRGLEPYRGFPQFIEAIARLQHIRPQCQVVVVGEDRVAYGKRLPDGKTYKTAMLEAFDLDLSRLHFTGYLPYSQYLQVLQISSIHVYLTRPFVLSWSLLEALSTGCVVLGSNTPPVKEVIQPGFNGFLVNFFDIDAIVAQLTTLLDHRGELDPIRLNARQTILDQYDLARLLPVHLHWLQLPVFHRR